MMMNVHLNMPPTFEYVCEDSVESAQILYRNLEAVNSVNQLASLQGESLRSVEDLLNEAPKHAKVRMLRDAMQAAWEKHSSHGMKIFDSIEESLYFSEDVRLNDSVTKIAQSYMDVLNFLAGKIREDWPSKDGLKRVEKLITWVNDAPAGFLLRVEELGVSVVPSDSGGPNKWFLCLYDTEQRIHAAPFTI